MKNLYLFGGAALLMALSACTKDGYQEITSTAVAQAISIITSEDDGSVVVTPGNYSFNITIKNYEGSGSVASPDLIANNTSLNFTTADQSYQSSGYDFFFQNVKATAGSTSMEINNDKFLAVYYYDEMYNQYGYYYDPTDIGKYTYILNNYPPYIAVAKYNIGSAFRVNTFPLNPFFRGETVTTYPMGVGTFTNDKMVYRFIINKDKDTNEFTADLILYNARFAQEMGTTLTAILVPGLSVDFSSTGVSITGENIEPFVYGDGGQYTPYPNYVFNSFNFKTTDAYYTYAVIDYKVAGMFNGHFEGSYLNTKFLK